jgi:uncharacterized protein
MFELARTAARALLRSEMAHPGREKPPPDRPEPEKTARPAANDLDGAIRQVRDRQERERLHGELASLRGDRENDRFHVVVFGTGSAGKTSLINAFLGHDVGQTGPTIGTTRGGETHSHTIVGLEGTLVLTDTPGISEVGKQGSVREAEARQTAARADLILFVVEADMVRTELEVLELLCQLEKRTIVVLNKKDRYNGPDLEAILERLRRRVTGLVPAEDIVPVAAAPRPIPVRVVRPDGSIESVLEFEQPDLEPLEERIAAILEREGGTLRAGNLLLRAYLLRKAAQLEIERQRNAQAEAIIERFQWMAAGTIFANPVPELDMVAAGAVEYRMISEIGGVYEANLSPAHIRMIAEQMIHTLIRRRVVTVITAMLGGLFKTTLIAYAAGGAVEAVTIAYLTHVTGHAFHEYFRNGQDWGEGGMQAALARQLDSRKRTTFLKEFVRQALARLGGPTARK